MTVHPSSVLPRISPLTLSAFWFGTAFHWLVLLLILMPENVVHFVGEQNKGTYLGILTAIGAIIALVLPPWIGAQSDRSGKRIPYIRLGVMVNVAGLIVMMLAISFMQGMSGFWVYVLGFLLVQFGNNYATAPYSALIPQLVPVEERGRYSGVMAMLQAGGQLLGAVSAFALGMLHLPPLVTFALVAVVLVVPALITMRGVPEEQGAAKQTSGETGDRTLSIVELFRYQPFLWVFLTRVLFALGQYSVQPFLQYYNNDVLDQDNAGTSTSIMLACIIVGSIASAFIGGKISDRIGRKPVIYVAGGLMAGVAILLLFAPNFTVALLLALVFGLGFGAFTSVDWALGSDAMPSGKSYARDMGIWHVAFVGPQFASAPQGRLLDWGNTQATNLGYTLVFGIAALFFLLGVILVRNVPEKVHRQSRP